MKTQIDEKIVSHAIDCINETSEGIYGCDLHSRLFNEDYFIIGYYNAEEFLKNTDEGVFGCIGVVQDYEKDNFGEVITDLESSEKVANMYAYIKGEELLQESETLREKLDDKLTEKDLQDIKKELEEL